MKAELAAVSLLAASLTGCSSSENLGHDPANSFVIDGTVSVLHDDYVLIKDAADIAGKEKGIDVVGESRFIRLDDNYFDKDCQRREVSDALDLLRSAGKIAVGSRVVATGTVGTGYKCKLGVNAGPGDDLLLENISTIND